MKMTVAWITDVRCSTKRIPKTTSSQKSKSNKSRRKIVWSPLRSWTSPKSISTRRWQSTSLWTCWSIQTCAIITQSPSVVSSTFCGVRRTACRTYLWLYRRWWTWSNRMTPTRHKNFSMLCYWSWRRSHRQCSNLLTTFLTWFTRWFMYSQRTCSTFLRSWTRINLSPSCWATCTSSCQRCWVWSSSHARMQRCRRVAALRGWTKQETQWISFPTLTSTFWMTICTWLFPCSCAQHPQGTSLTKRSPKCSKQQLKNFVIWSSAILLENLRPKWSTNS